LIITADKKVYHLHIDASDIADTILLVGDPARAAAVSEYFDQIDCQISNREFITHTGSYKGKKLSVISTGIGTDNIDIVLNELDAAVNFDLTSKTERKEKKSLTIIRLGTCGALQSDIDVDTLICSSHGLGFDGLLNFYEGSPAFCEEDLSMAFVKHSVWPHRLPFPYCVSADASLLKHFTGDLCTGITATAPGFYGPQGRQLRLKSELPSLDEQLASFKYQSHRIVNFEMETSALYGLGKMLGHKCLSICVAIANRSRGEFSNDYKKSVDTLIQYTLNKLVQA
jgi:uridine phosphorylase